MPLINKVFDTTKKPDVVEIAIWGPPQSGKTNYLAMLLLSPKPTGWSLNAGIKTTKFLGDGYQYLLEEKEFIPPTLDDDGDFYPFNFNIPGDFFRSKTYTVFLPEYPGEYYENPERHPEFTKRIAKSHGIIWLVDPIEIDNPTSDRKSYTRMILEWLGILQEYQRQGSGKIKTHMAFCLTKMDHENHVKGFENPRAYCLQKLGRPIQYFLENFCEQKRVNFFATSTAGFRHGTQTSNVDPNDDNKLLNPPEPINLFVPFSWLFNVI